MEFLSDKVKRFEVKVKMKKYTLIFLFLLFDLSFINGHTLAKIEMLDNKPVYEVTEGESSLIITHPKDAQPTLREIVYFHIIEKPYNDDQTEDVQVPEVKNKSPVIETPRSFTNGHGYQYLKEDDDSGALRADNDNDDSEVPDEENKNNVTPEPDKYDEKTDQNTEAGTGFTVRPAINNDDEFTNDTDDEDTENEFANDIDDGPKIVDDEDDDPQKFGDGSEPADDTDIQFGDNTDDTEASVTQEEQKRREKREIDYSNLPDAPSLPELNLDIFPDYIKAILMKEPDTYQQARETENLEDEIEREVKQLEKAVNHPPKARKGKSQERKARTYGMRLTGDSGVVWNDVSAPHVTYRVGEPENHSSITSKPEDVSASTIKDTTTPMYEPTKDNNNENGNSGESNDNVDSDEFKDIEKSFGEIEKMLDELIKDSTSKPDVSENKDDTSKKPDSLSDITTEMITSESTTETLNKKEGSEDELSTPKPDNEKKPDSSKDTEEGKKDDKKPDVKKNTNKETIKHDEDSKQKQFVMDIMKNKYFWQWLQDSSTAYLEVMMKKVDVLIKAEVKKQIEQYFKEHKNDSNCKPQNNSTSEKPTEISKPIKTGNVTDTVDSTIQNPIVNNTTEKNIPAENDEPVNDNNDTEEEARKNNKESNDQKTDAPVKIEAQNVYGNSVGNGKVTNIFIFNISKESDLKNIQPLNNGTNGVFVFGLDDKKPDQEKKDKDHQDEDETENSKDTTTTTTKLQTTPKEPITSDNHLNSTLKPENDKETVTSTEKPMDEPPQDLSKEDNVTKEEKEKPVTEKEEEKPVVEKPIDTNSSLSDIEKKPFNSSNTDSLPNDNNENADNDKLEETHDNEDKTDKTEKTPDNEDITATDDTNTSGSTNNDSDEVSKPNNTAASTDNTKNDKVSTDRAADTETKEKAENNSKENEIDHND